MSVLHTTLKRITKLGLVLTMVVTMSACSKNWKEEVQLSDGRVIVVERELLTESGGDEWAVNRSGSKPKEHRIKFEYPAGQLVEWRSIKKSPQTWPEIPLIFDMDAGQPVVFSIVAIDATGGIYSKYVYRNGAWIEEMLPEKFEKQLTNLFLKFSAGISNVNLETKRKMNSSVDFRQYLKQVGPNRQVAFN